MVPQREREATREQQQRRLRVQQVQRLELARGLPHDSHQVVLHELVRADRRTNHHRAVALDLDPLGHVDRVEVSMACSQQNGGLGRVEPHTSVFFTREEIY